MTAVEAQLWFVPLHACGRQSLLIQNELVSEAVITGSTRSRFLCILCILLYMLVALLLHVSVMCISVYTLKIHTCVCTIWYCFTFLNAVLAEITIVHHLLCK